MSAARAEAARRRMAALSPDEMAARVAALQAGRRRARSPEALAEVERRIDELGAEFKSLPRGNARRLEILTELRPLGRRRVSLKYGE